MASRTRTPRTSRRASSRARSRRSSSRPTTPRRAASAPTCAPASTASSPNERKAACRARSGRRARRCYSLDFAEAEAELARSEPADGRTPEQYFHDEFVRNALRDRRRAAARGVRAAAARTSLPALRALRARPRSGREADVREARRGVRRARHAGDELSRLRAPRVPAHRARDAARDHGDATASSAKRRGGCSATPRREVALGPDGAPPAARRRVARPRRDEVPPARGARPRRHGHRLPRRGRGARTPRRAQGRSATAAAPAGRGRADVERGARSSPGSSIPGIVPVHDAGSCPTAASSTR